MGVDSVTGAVYYASGLLDPVTTTFSENLGVLLPIGITVMAVMIGVALIPRIIHRFF